MEISERQMRRMVADVDDRHHESMKTFDEEQRELLFGEVATKTQANRRQFLKRAGLGGVALTIGSQVVPLKSLLLPAAAQDAPSDKDIAAFAASFEFAAVEAYKAAAASGKVKTPAVGEAAGKFAGHHMEHGQAFANYAGREIKPNQKILEMVGGQLQAAGDEKAVIELAYGLENAAASTYLFGLGVLQDPAAFKAAASILPVESEHAIVLGMALGKDLKDEQFMPAFEKTDQALDPSKFPVEQ